MRRLVLLLPFLAGCASWSPSLTDAGTAAREIACVVCQATGGPSEQAAKHAEALERLTRALALLAGDRDEVRAILERLERIQAQQRRDFDELFDLATAPGGSR